MNNMSQEWVRTQWNKKISKAELYTHKDQASNQWTSQFLETGNDVAIGQLLGEKIRCSAHTFEQYMKNYSYLTSKQDMQLKIIFEQTNYEKFESLEKNKSFLSIVSRKINPFKHSQQKNTNTQLVEKNTLGKANLTQYAKKKKRAHDF